MALLWPEPTVISYPRRFARLVDGGVQFVVAPRLSSPRLVLPRRPHRATAGALANYKASATGGEALKVRALSRALRAGLGELLSGKIVIQPGGAPHAGIDAYLGEVLGRPVLLSLYIGKARAVQKPVLQVLSDTGHTMAFAKLGINPLTRDLLTNEARALGILQDVDLRHLAVPELLHHGQWRDHEVIVQRAVRRAGSGVVSRDALRAATREVSEVHGTSDCRLLESPYWQSLSARVRALPPSSHTAVLTDAMATLDERLRPVTLGFGSWHGDWAPWNMTADDNGVVAWDWEHFQSGVPIGFDAVHHRVQEHVVFERLDPAEAFSRARAAARSVVDGLAVRPEDAEVVVLLYLLEIATRYLEDDEVSVAETRMSRLETWFAHAVSAALDALPREPPG